MDSMNMTSSSSDSSMSNTTDSSMDMSTMMMKAYLHFTPGDTLIFEGITPSSGGAIFGACLVFFVISVADRYLRAVTRGMEHRLAERSKRLEVKYHFGSSTEGIVANDSKSTTAESQVSAPRRFILSHEISRSLLACLSTTVHYLLMLVVMTFNASFIISIILGVFMGEFAFGRLHTFN